MNVAYEMDFDIEGFLRAMDRRARAATERRAGRGYVDRRAAVRDRKARQAETGSESAPTAQRA